MPICCRVKDSLLHGSVIAQSSVFGTEGEPEGWVLVGVSNQVALQGNPSLGWFMRMADSSQYVLN